MLIGRVLVVIFVGISGFFGKIGVKLLYWRKFGGGDLRVELFFGSWLFY